MKKRIIIVLALLVPLAAWAATGKLQNADFATAAQITGAGGTIAQLLNTSKIYDSTNAQLLDTTIAGKLNTSAFTDTAVTSKLITGYVSGAGTVAATDTILQAIQKLNGNVAAISPGITQLTGDVTAGPGSGSQASTIANLAVTNAKIANSTIDLTAKVTGVLPIANGGTNSSTALNNNRMIASQSGALTELAAMTPNRIVLTDANGLTVHGAASSTETGYLVGVTSAIQTQLNAKLDATLNSANIFVGNGSNVATGVAMSGDISISNTGATAYSGTVPVNKGGTGQTSYTDGQLLIGNSSGNTLTKSTLTAGSNVTITNGNGSITIAATGGSSAIKVWDGYLDATDNTWTTSSATYGDTAAGTSVTLTENNNSGMGTVTAAASGLPGIQFTCPASGYYMITVKGSYQNNGNNTQSLRLLGGSTVIDATTYDTMSGSVRRNFIAQGLYNCTNTSTNTTFKLQGAVNGGTLGITNAALNFTGGHSLLWQVSGPY